MPLYRLNNSGNWKKVFLYRLNNAGNWRRLVAYRLNNAGNWRRISTPTQEVPVVQTRPVLQNQLSSRDLFYSEDTLTLTRGTYTNTTADSNTSYRMTIYKSINSATSLSNWTVASRSTFTGANSTETTSITYNITDQDAKDGYYFAAEVRVDNAASDPNSLKYDIETILSGGGAQRILSRIFFEANSFTVTPTATGASFFWGVTGIADSSFLYQDAANSASIVRITRSDNQQFVYDAPASLTLANGMAKATIPSGTLTASTGYRADLILIGNDGWKTSNDKTRSNKGAITSGITFLTFTTKATPPQNQVAPTVGPLNNRSRLPVNTLLTATQGTWTNVSVSTTYRYNWIIVDLPSESVIPSNNVGSTRTISSDNNGDNIYVEVEAQNTGSDFITATSVTYGLDPEVIPSSISPTTATVNEARSFNIAISGYPTQYTIDWGDGTTSGPITVTSGTSNVSTTISKTYTAAGTYVAKITAQPGNKQSQVNIVVSVPAPSGGSFNRIDSTTAPSQPSTITFTSSNNQVTSSWTNGSPLEYVRFQGSGAGVNANYTDTSAPFIQTDTSPYFSSGTYTATVTNYYKSIDVSWGQSNTKSYKIIVSSSVFGTEEYVGNDSGSSVSRNIAWASNKGTFSWTELTLYSELNQAGTFTTYTNPGNFLAITPTERSSVRTNSVSLTYIQPEVRTTGAMRRVSLPSAFTNSSQNIWIGTNGYVSLTVDPTTSPGTSWPSAGGIVVGPGVVDLVQTSLSTLSDASNYYVYWKGHRYNDTSKELWYLMKFYWNSTTVDVFFERFTLTDASGDAVRNGTTVNQTWANSTSITGMSIPGGMTTISNSLALNNTDDGRTPITAAKPTAPINISIPVVTPSTGVQGSQTFSTTNGSWNPDDSDGVYQYQWQYFDQGSSWLSAPASIVSPFNSTSSTYRPPSNYVSLYGSQLRCRVRATNSINSTDAFSSPVTVTAVVAPFFPFFPPYFPFFPPFFPFFPPYFPFFPPYFPFFPPYFPFFPPYFPTFTGSPPQTPTGLSIGGSGFAMWNASTGATSYTLEWYAARNSTGTTGSPAVLGPFTNNTTVTSFQITYPTFGGFTYNYVRGRVRANNTAGSSAYSAWFPSATTYV